MDDTQRLAAELDWADGEGHGERVHDEMYCDELYGGFAAIPEFTDEQLRAKALARTSFGCASIGQPGELVHEQLVAAFIRGYRHEAGADD